MAVLRLRKRNARAVACSHEAAALKKLESEAQFVNQQAQIERSAEQNAALEKLEAETQFKRKMLQAELEAGVSSVEEMAEWLKRHRLARHAEAIARVAGLCVPSELVNFSAAVG